MFFFIPIIVISQPGKKSSEKPLRQILEETRKTEGINFIYSDDLLNGITVKADQDYKITLNNLKTFLNQYNLSYKKFDNEYVLIKNEIDEEPYIHQAILTDERIENNNINGLQTRPVLLSYLSPPYPRTAVRKGVEGSVCVKFLVKKDGHVVNSEVLISSGSEILDSAARDYAYNLHYSPGEMDGKPQDTWISIIFRYTLENKKSE